MSENRIQCVENIESMLSLTSLNLGMCCDTSMLFDRLDFFICIFFEILAI